MDQIDFSQERRLIALLEDLKRASARLKEILLLEPTQPHQDGTIQRFEFTFELCWKLMQELCAYRGKQTFGPTASIKTAAEVEIIIDPQSWLKFLEDRNITTHTYREYDAAAIYRRIKNFPPLVDQLIASAEKILVQ